ncbi:MAG: histone deacetylase, partial [bacterium]|nr:histone deacetylase [bacterium]
MSTGFVYSEDYLLHDSGSWHPEHPGRLLAIVDHLQAIGLMQKLKHIAPIVPELKWVETIHSSAYINAVKKACENGYTQLDPDTGIGRDSYRVALLAVGGALAAADAIMRNEISNCFCAVRPPGHHAERVRARGFCLFNNIAILARYLQQKYQMGKILIVDWDLHHGNGTQNAFYDDPTVFYFSTHLYPFFPGSGAKYETGSGNGIGYTLNFPLPAGKNDDDYLEIFQEELLPAADKFRPDFILISAGFDAHANDFLSSMLLTESGYAA